MVAIGVIRLGEDHEYFESVLGFWGLDDYKAIWTAGLRRLISGASTSCLATSVTDPSSANFVEVWPLYREESDVYVQNHLLFLDQLPHELDPMSRGRLCTPAPLSMKMARESQSGGSALTISKNSSS